MTKRKIVKIVLNTENFESFTIPVEAITDLRIGGITTAITGDGADQLTRFRGCRDLVGHDGGNWRR